MASRNYLLILLEPFDGNGRVPDVLDLGKVAGNAEHVFTGDVRNALHNFRPALNRLRNVGDTVNVRVVYLDGYDDRVNVEDFRLTLPAPAITIEEI